ncbi:YfhD family protein [Halobacillus sp. A1]|uniref:YfhD family protein n=1 Tax=Halobacillus campisalis TaxID=435909 RepID=A0ABW2K6S0_9BACI|nr:MULTISPECIES: YfhD family protein [Halobacillus]MCP3031316.1 YfhD family protein [Halobacillus sp. A1]
MGRDEHKHSNPKKKQKLSQTPGHAKFDGFDVEFSQDMADHDDLEAIRRSEAADRRANHENKTKR